MAQNNAPPPKPFVPTPQAMRRAVASSTALETGQTVEQLEHKLRNDRQKRFAHVKLAD